MPTLQFKRILVRFEIELAVTRKGRVEVWFFTIGSDPMYLALPTAFPRSFFLALATLPLRIFVAFAIRLSRTSLCTKFFVGYSSGNLCELLSWLRRSRVAGTACTIDTRFYPPEVIVPMLSPKLSLFHSTFV
jgi:hypothetical protein